jgi:hypothetical protein
MKKPILIGALAFFAVAFAICAAITYGNMQRVASPRFLQWTILASTCAIAIYVIQRRERRRDAMMEAPCVVISAEPEFVSRSSYLSPELEGPAPVSEQPAPAASELVTPEPPPRLSVVSMMVPKAPDPPVPKDDEETAPEEAASVSETGEGGSAAVSTVEAPPDDDPQLSADVAAAQETVREAASVEEIPSPDSTGDGEEQFETAAEIDSAAGPETPDNATAGEQADKEKEMGLNKDIAALQLVAERIEKGLSPSDLDGVYDLLDISEQIAQMEEQLAERKGLRERIPGALKELGELEAAAQDESNHRKMLLLEKKAEALRAWILSYYPPLQVVRAHLNTPPSQRKEGGFEILSEFLSAGGKWAIADLLEQDGSPNSSWLDEASLDQLDLELQHWESQPRSVEQAGWIAIIEAAIKRRHPANQPTS